MKRPASVNDAPVDTGSGGSVISVGCGWSKCPSQPQSHSENDVETNMSSTVPGRRRSPRSHMFVISMCYIDPARQERPPRDESSTLSGHAFELPRCCLNVQSCRPSCKTWSSSCSHPKGLGGYSGCARYLSHAQNQSAAMGAQANRASAAATYGRVLQSLPGQGRLFRTKPVRALDEAKV